LACACCCTLATRRSRIRWSLSSFLLSCLYFVLTTCRLGTVLTRNSITDTRAQECVHTLRIHRLPALQARHCEYHTSLLASPRHFPILHPPLHPFHPSTHPPCLLYAHWHRLTHAQFFHVGVLPSSSGWIALAGAIRVVLSSAAITMDRSSDWRRSLGLYARQCRKGMNASLPIEGAYSFYSFTFYAVAPPFSRPGLESRAARTACVRVVRVGQMCTARVRASFVRWLARANTSTWASLSCRRIA
jgi:hypothetical protein